MTEQGGVLYKSITIHASQLRMLTETCPLQYEMRYAKGIKRPPMVVAMRGTAVHQGVRHNFVHKLHTGEDASFMDIFDVVSDSWEKSIQGYEPDYKTGEWIEGFDPADIQWFDTKPGNVKDDAISVVKTWRMDTMPIYVPLAIEEYFEVIWEADWIGLDYAIKFGGTLDLRCSVKDISNVLLDWKTGEKSWPQDRAHREYQPYFYYIGHQAKFGDLPEGFIFEVAAILAKAIKTEAHVTDRTPEQLARFFRHVITPACKMVAAGIFPAATSGWHCSDKYCGYWLICPAITQAPKKIFDMSVRE